MKIITPPHKKTSRICTEEDIKSTVMASGEPMRNLCHEPLGKYPGAMAIAHCQVEADDPLRFFVASSGEIFINPIIIEKSNPFKSDEGCMSYPFRDMKKVRRYANLVVSYQTILKNGIVQIQNKDIDGKLAVIMQHEIQHFKGKTIYD